MSFSFLNSGALFYKFFFLFNFPGPQVTAYLALRLGRPCQLALHERSQPFTIIVTFALGCNPSPRITLFHQDHTLSPKVTPFHQESHLFTKNHNHGFKNRTRPAGSTGDRCLIRFDSLKKQEFEKK